MKFIFGNVSIANIVDFGYEGIKEEYSDFENIYLDYAGCEITKIDRAYTGYYDIEFEDGHKIHEVSSEYIKMVEL